MAKTSPAKITNRITELIFLLAVLITAVFLWDTYFIYPIKLFVVLIHELSHALIAIITGGTVKSIEIGFDLGGKIDADGGSEIAISSAGYIGSLFIGLLLFISAHRPKFGKYFLFTLTGILIITLVSSNPTLTFGLLVIVVCISLVLFAVSLSNKIIALIVKAIAMSSILYVLVDIKEDVFSKNLTSDAEILSNLTGINSLLIGIIWIAFSVICLLLLIRWVYFSKKTNRL